ncbi:hypothetical protein BRADI_3g54273v3 [Brachypodium distachyon]|uniref:Uncharacterized protein n=1 Tax=Brachypodium distachyon TaxID=15368 RepID=A0A2K2D4Z8_BRADI|nr:hypothetical protein BRADI_3g54273v3 [Brachypodium distachyon]
MPGTPKIFEDKTVNRCGLALLFVNSVRAVLPVKSFVLDVGTLHTLCLWLPVMAVRSLTEEGFISYGMEHDLSL